jgi:photosystem II stability/assembly factor-like uncharacterized protein
VAGSFEKDINMKLFYSIILFVTLTNLVNAQEEEPFWENIGGPPQGEIFDIVVTGDNDIYVSSPNGIFLSTNEGKNWNCIFSDNTSKLSVSNDDRLFIIDGYSSKKSTTKILYTSNKGKNWVETNNLWINKNIFAGRICFNTEDYLFCSSTENNNYTLYYSKDYGNNWISTNFLLEKEIENGMNLKDKNVLWKMSAGLNGEILLGGYYEDYDTQYGYIYYGLLYIFSEDCSSWEKHLLPSPIHNWDVLSEKELLVACGDGLLLTTDKGATWEEILDIDSKSVIAINENEFLCGTIREGVFYTSDRGKTWEKRSSGLPNDYITNFAKGNNGNIYATGITGFNITTDKGLTWEQRNNGFTAANVYNIAFDSKGTMYAVDHGVYSSSDHGETWEYLGLQEYPITEIIITKNDEILVGSYIKGFGIYRSDDYGKTWQLSSEGLPMRNETDYVGIYDLMEGSDGTIYSAPANIYHSTDGGKTWLRPEINPYGVCYCIAENNEGDVFVGHSSCRVSRSTDKGKTWEVMTSSGHGLQDSKVIFFHPDTTLGFLGANYIHHTMTTNNGRTWLKSGIDYDDKFLNTQDATMDQYKRIYYIGNKSVVRTTNNNPDNFYEYEVIKTGINHDCLCISASPDGYVYVGTEYGGIYRSRERYVSVEDNSKNPSKVILSPPVPNPTTSETNISFDLPESCRIQIRICDVLGNTISIINKYYSQGRHTEIFNFDSYPSGVYLISLSAFGEVVTEKVEVVK